jgi:hypothetical protein
MKSNRARRPAAFIPVLPLFALGLALAVPAAASVRTQIEAVSTGDASFLSKHYISDGKVLYAVHGMKERRQVRFANALRAFSPDKQAVYAEMGWPHSRYRVDDGGRITEVWAYYDTARAFVFDASGRRIETRWF